MDLTTALEFAGSRPHSVLTTIRNDTRPQLSTVMHRLGDDGLIRISVTATRAKYKNMLRRPWAALHVSAEDEYSYVVIEADVTFSAVAADEHDEAVQELIAYYRSVVGEHPDWDNYRKAMVSDQRVLAKLAPTRAYGMLQLPEAD